MDAQVVPFRAAPSKPRTPTNRAHAARWKHEELFDRGYVSVPVRFLDLYANLKPFCLTPSEAMFVVHLIRFKWTSDAPFPSYRVIAKQMGVTEKQVQRYAQSLETKHLLKRVQREGQTNEFDLEPLFDAIKAAIEQDGNGKS